MALLPQLPHRQIHTQQGRVPVICDPKERERHLEEGVALGKMCLSL